MARKKLKTTPWDAADYLNTPNEIAAYLEAVLEEGDPALFSAALGDIARSKGMAEVARRTGMGRESLYKALSSGGNPKLSTILKVFEALGLRLRAEPAKPIRSRAARATPAGTQSVAR